MKTACHLEVFFYFYFMQKHNKPDELLSCVLVAAKSCCDKVKAFSLASSPLLTLFCFAGLQSR